MVKEVAYSLNSQTSLSKKNQNGSSLKTYQDSSIVIKGKISRSSYKRWENSGMAYLGEFWMQNILEHPKDVDVCSLWQVLETSAHLKYFLSPTELSSLIDRALARKKPLPTQMQKNFEKQISILSNTQALEENQKQDRKPKAIGMMVKHIRSTQEAPRTLYARRMLPIEYERLQGFPDNWTQLDTEP